MISKKNQINLIFLVVTFAILLFSYVYIILRNAKFNRTERFIDLCDIEESDDIGFSWYARGEQNDSWTIALSEAAQRMTGYFLLQGITYDAVFENKTPYEITDWKIKFEITDSCFVETAWCGKVEFSQKFGKLQVNQVVDLRNYEEKDLSLRYLKSADHVFFPMVAGDYFIYHPSKENKEMPLVESVTGRPNSTARIGFNIYNTPGDDPLVFTKGQISYFINKRVSKDSAFKTLLFISAIWVFALVVFVITESRFKDLELQEVHDKKMVQEVMETFAGFVDAKDPYTGGHSFRVAKYSKQLGEELGLDKKQCQIIFYCGLLHDCGKIGIHDDILSKPERLSDSEFEKIREHTINGFEILSGLTAIPETCIVARYHHERYDGKGYPDGLKGESIPLYARIICVADSFDAMNTNRCYRKHMTASEILEQIRENEGVQFDPKVAQALIRLLARGEIAFGE